MGLQKKHGKGRLDKWYKLAKEKGYRARAAFKLIQLNQKYGFLQQSRVLLDLCAAPGSWSQVAAATMPVNSIIVAMDLAPIKPIPKVITFQADITTDKCRSTIRSHLKSWKADTVLHDGAPNVGTAWVQDAYDQAALVLKAMKLATEFLAKGGTFVTKVFRSKDYNSLLWVFNQLFTKVEATKPPSSRDVSAEIFVVCRGYKAPKVVDPRFLDARSVFEELADPTPNNEAKVYNPVKKRRQREGYEDGNYIQFKEVTASHFVRHTDPLEILAGSNKIAFAQTSSEDIAQAAIAQLPETTEEVRRCCDDLKVLGRKEFKMLLKWRLKLRERFALASTKDDFKKDTENIEVAEVESMDDEVKMQEDLQHLEERQTSRKKRERRRDNERKHREIVRMQLNMTMPTEIGLEQSGPNGEGAMFDLKTIERSRALSRAEQQPVPAALSDTSDEDSSLSGSDFESDEEEDQLDRQLDGLYESYIERVAEKDKKYQAKRARKEHSDEEWEGFSGDDEQASKRLRLDDYISSSDNEEGGAKSGKLLTDLQPTHQSEDGMSRRASKFFNQQIFKDMGVGDFQLAPTEAENTRLPLREKSNPVQSNGVASTTTQRSSLTQTGDAGAEDDSDFEIVKNDKEGDWIEGTHDKTKSKPLDIEIVTAEAMTLAHQIALGEKTIHNLEDEGFNKYSFRDRDGLPDWFLDDEKKHSKAHRPITKAAANAIKEKERALNARPIKKVREAKDRKKFKAAQRLEKLRQKSALLENDEALSERDKAQSIARLMSRATKKKPDNKVQVVVARGGNRGISGRPGGVKGRYKIVDARLKKDVRAQKRLSKKRK
ncbi:MAG: AdoMet-dependent rRNA methyltransferase spb1 [Vezdaea aestivalis]|nr:MAG: AdoMet-dependent rRNA methyltransferase spb1 [Vezdaea aestivalis]